MILGSNNVRVRHKSTTETSLGPAICGAKGKTIELHPDWKMVSCARCLRSHRARLVGSVRTIEQDDRYQVKQSSDGCWIIWDVDDGSGAYAQIAVHSYPAHMKAQAIRRAWNLNRTPHCEYCDRPIEGKANRCAPCEGRVQ